MTKNVKRNKNQSGGDGYSIIPNRAIGGLPAFARYSNNYRPIFEGDLLQNGGSSDNKCGCNKAPETIFDLIKQGGGKKESSKKITQFSAIKEIAHNLSPLSSLALKKIIVKTYLNNLSQKNNLKSKQYGGYADKLQNILAPLGKNNLLVIATLLLLHHFAVESKNKRKSSFLSGGGNPFIQSLTKILAPTGLNSLGASIILLLIGEAFITHKKTQKSRKQHGGNPLKDLIAPLGTNAFIATGLLIVLDKLFTNKIKKMKAKDPIKKKMIGGKVKENYEKLFNLVAPITFNAFATKDFLTKMAN